MTSPFSTRRALLALVVLSALLFFPALGQRDLTASHEARAAMNAQSMLSDGCWGLPHLFDQRPEMQKPPLFYWLVAFCGSLQGGVDAWSVRLPAALAALGCVLLLFLLGCKTGQPRLGFLAGILLATSGHFTWLARVGRIDMPLTLTVTAALVGLHLARVRRGEGQGSWPWFLLAYLATGLGLLLKGPIAGVLIGLVATVHKITAAPAQGRWGKSLSSLWWGVPLVLALAGPWYLWANLETNNRFWDVFFIHHNLERGLGGTEDLAAYPVWYYVPRLFLDALPWSLTLPLALLVYFRRGWWKQNDLARFGFLWFASIFGFLSCMSFKRADYLLPAYPGLALFLAGVGHRWWLAKQNEVSAAASWLLGSKLRGVGWGLMTCYVAGWLVFHVTIAPRLDGDRPYETLARDMRRQTRMPIIFFRAEEHCLAFHLGRPVATVLEWENLGVWASKPEPIFVVMPEHFAREAPRLLPQGELTLVTYTRHIRGTNPKRPAVIMRSRGAPAPELAGLAIPQP